MVGGVWDRVTAQERARRLNSGLWFRFEPELTINRVCVLRSGSASASASPVSETVQPFLTRTTVTHSRACNRDSELYR